MTPRESALYADSCELARWLKTARLSDRDREGSRRVIESVKSGALPLEEAMEIMK